MPRSVVKKTVKPQALHQDPIVWGIAGAYLVGMLMVGTIGAMTNLASLKGNYNRSEAAYIESQTDLVNKEANTSAAMQTPGAIPGAENVLVNGSFENVVIRSQSKILVDGTSGLGWKVAWANDKPRQMSLTRQPGVEILAGYMGWQPSNGSQFARFDTADLGARSARTQSLVTLSQDVKAEAGTYYLSFDFAAQPKSGVKDNEVEIKWDGKSLGTVSADGSKDTKPVWKNHRYTVKVTGTGGTLEIVGKGEENNQGNLLDNFILTPVVK